MKDMQVKEALSSNFVPFTKDDQCPEISCIFARDVQRHGLRSTPSVLRENVFNFESEICQRCMQCVCQQSYKNCNYSTICNTVKFNERGTILVFCPTNNVEHFSGKFPLSGEICPVCNRAQGDKINECIPQVWPIDIACMEKEMPFMKNASISSELHIYEQNKSNPVIKDMLKSIGG